MGGTQFVGQMQGGSCQVCGAPLEADAMFCIVCGAQVNQAPAMQPAAPQPQIAGVQQPKQFADTQRVVESMPGGGTCASCGNPLEPGAQFCVVCGAPVVTGGGIMDNYDMAFVSGNGAAPSSCPQCGYPLEPDAMYCISCGMKIDSPAKAGGVGPNNGGTQLAWGEQPYGQPSNQPYGVSQQTGPVRPVPAPPAADNDDDASVLSSLVMLSAAEARTGCVKRIEIDKSTHESVEVDIPAGVNVTTKLDVPGYGVFDELSGRRGPLRLSFFII